MVLLRAAAFMSRLVSLPLYTFPAVAHRGFEPQIDRLSFEESQLLQVAQAQGAPNGSPSPAATVNCSALARYHQTKATQLQGDLSKLQAPANCVCARRLVYNSPNTEGFAHTMHLLGFMLMTGLMSERTVLPVGDIAYCPSNARRYLLCFFDAAVAPCSHNYSHTVACDKGEFQPAYFEQKFGPTYLENVHGPMAMVHGPNRSIEIQLGTLPTSVDVMVHRVGVMSTRYLEMGNFWLRSQVQGWAWQLNPQIRQYVAQHPVLANLGGKKYVGIHLRTSDIRLDNFSVDVQNAITLERALKAAAKFRAMDSRVSSIFLATDDQAVDKEAEQVLPMLQKQGWQMYWASSASLASKEQETKYDGLEEYRSSVELEAIVDIQGLRNAEYLVGSMLSNVFRLAVELNSARKALEGVVDENCDDNHYYSLDLPWHQDM